MTWQRKARVGFSSLWPCQAQRLVRLILFAVLALTVACQGVAPASETQPTATGTRVDAPTRDEAPAQTVAPFRGQVVLPSRTPTLTVTRLLLLVENGAETLVREGICPTSAVLSLLESGTEWTVPPGTVGPERCAENGRQYWPVVLEDGRAGWVDAQDVTAVR